MIREPKKYQAWTGFRLITRKRGKAYKDYVITAFQGFMSWLDPRIDKYHLAKYANYDIWNSEFRTPWIQLSDLENDFADCKLYFMDETQFGKNRRLIMFVDHYSERDVKKVFAIGDKFEEFLKEKEIKYKRFYRLWPLHNLK